MTCENEFELPPCVTHKTKCIEEFENSGGEVPCPLWKQGLCRPYKLIKLGGTGVEAKRNALHYMCAISLLMEPINEEERKEKKYFLFVITGSAIFEPEED